MKGHFIQFSKAAGSRNGLNILMIRLDFQKHDMITDLCHHRDGGGDPELGPFRTMKRARLIPGWPGPADLERLPPRAGWGGGLHQPQEGGFTGTWR